MKKSTVHVSDKPVHLTGPVINRFLDNSIILIIKILKYEEKIRKVFQKSENFLKISESF